MTIVSTVSRINCCFGSTTPRRATNEVLRLTTTSTAMPISSSGSTSKNLFSTEYTVANAMSRR
jgi:hypothetical protein